jgi:hypothetical protein
MNAQLAAPTTPLIPTPLIPTPLTLQHYPAAPVLRAQVASYFSVEGPADAALLKAARADDEAVLLFDLGPQPVAWMLRQGQRSIGHGFEGPLFGALLREGLAERLARTEPDGAFATQRLLLQLKAAPSMAFRIVALDRYLMARLIARTA